MTVWDKVAKEFVTMFADANSRFWFGYLIFFFAISLVFWWWNSPHPRNFKKHIGELFATYSSRSSLNDLKLGAVNVLFVAFVSFYIYDYSNAGSLIRTFFFGLVEGHPSFAGEAWLKYSLAGKILFVVMQVVAMDIAFFAWHYAYHRIPAFWELHKLHHSAEVLTPFTILRGDPYMMPFYLLLFDVAFSLNAAIFYFFFHEQPSALLLFNAPIGLFIMYAVRDHFCHSGLNISFGPVNYVILSPVQHQVHHSYLPQHQGKNLAFFFSFMDLLFGTFYNPKKGEEFRYGIDGMEEKKMNSLSLGGLLFYPLNAISKKIFISSNSTDR